MSLKIVFIKITYLSIIHAEEYLGIDNCITIMLIMNLLLVKLYSISFRIRMRKVTKEGNIAAAHSPRIAALKFVILFKLSSIVRSDVSKVI